jgi:hypothetical protein
MYTYICIYQLIQSSRCFPPGQMDRKKKKKLLKSSQIIEFVEEEGLVSRIKLLQLLVGLNMVKIIGLI